MISFYEQAVVQYYKALKDYDDLLQELCHTPHPETLKRNRILGLMKDLFPLILRYNMIFSNYEPNKPTPPSPPKPPVPPNPPAGKPPFNAA